MGNCAGVFSACQGDGDGPVHRVDRNNMKLALDKNRQQEIEGLEIKASTSHKEALVKGVKEEAVRSNLDENTYD